MARYLTTSPIKIMTPLFGGKSKKLRHQGPSCKSTIPFGGTWEHGSYQLQDIGLLTGSLSITPKLGYKHLTFSSIYWGVYPSPCPKAKLQLAPFEQ